MDSYDWHVLFSKYKPFFIALSIWAWVVSLADIAIEGLTPLNLFSMAFGFIALFAWTVFRDS